MITPDFLAIARTCGLKQTLRAGFPRLDAMEESRARLPHPASTQLVLQITRPHCPCNRLGNRKGALSTPNIVGMQSPPGDRVWATSSIPRSLQMHPCNREARDGEHHLKTFPSSRHQHFLHQKSTLRLTQHHPLPLSPSPLLFDSRCPVHAHAPGHHLCCACACRARERVTHTAPRAGGSLAPEESTFQVRLMPSTAKAGVRVPVRVQGYVCKDKCECNLMTQVACFQMSGKVHAAHVKRVKI